MKLEGISVEGIIKYCEKTLKELKDTNYQFGFDIFMSTDGIRFMPICLNGLGNRDNYGGRILFVSSENKLYIGTANPYEGCELWESDDSLRLLKMQQLKYKINKIYSKFLKKNQDFFILILLINCNNKLNYFVFMI